MKKKVVFLIMVLLLALGAGCKKKAEPVAEAPPPPPPPPKISQTEYARNVGNLPEVRSLEPGEAVTVSIDPQKVDSLTATTARIERFKSEYTYDEMLEKLKHGYLTAIWPAERPSLLILFNNDLEEYRDFYMKYPDSKFRLLDPRPEYQVTIGKELYWVTASGNLWKGVW